MTTSWLRIGLASMLSIGALAHSVPAASQASAYPSQPIKLIVPSPPGGEADAVARLVADELQTRLPGSVIVDNKPGAGVTLGSAFVARSPPDGYTLLLGGSGLTASPAVLKSASDPVKDFTPISQVMSLEFYVLVRADSKIRTLADLVALSRTSQLNYGSAGQGSITHFQMEMLKSLAKFDATHIPYRGTAPALTALLASDVQVMFAGTPALPHIRAGALRAIAVAMPTRSQDFPQVATVEETYPDFSVVGWTGILGPHNLSPSIVERLNTAIVAMAADPAFATKIRAMGGQARSSTPRAMGERLKSETARFSALAVSLGIQPQ